MITLSARAPTEDHLALKSSFEMHKQPIVRLWGLTAQRGWARIILDRLDALAHGSAGAPTEMPPVMSMTPPNTITSLTLTMGKAPLTVPASAGAVVVHEVFFVRAS